MDFNLLHLNVKCEMDVKEEILAIVTTENEIFIKEEPKDSFPEEGLTFNQSEEFKNLETFETEEIMKACYNYRETESVQHLQGFTREYEDESKMNIENFTKNMSESFSKEIERMFQCHLCSFRTNKKWTLKRHLLVHSNLKRFKCIQCGAEFKQKSDMNAHLIVHSDIKPFECSYCGLTFKRKKDLKVHLEHYNEGETKTVQNLKRLSSEKEKKLKVKKENLSQKSDSSSSSKEKSRDFHCHLCSFRTYKKWTLKRHLLVHSNLKECDLNAHSQEKIVTNLKCIARNLNAYEHISTNILS
ncbi:Zinc finger Y-chromosomal protein [Armadillidium nasatum]|uniref:Zinc finger Y-chromosomal protein n=1 Tax=Armadillidium nasatum TaxID=96803 RepID=A0A5N5T032_9CRUS|nr:Zinc finger Y-chromosomal protein [Armadillidium nasatum]